MRTVKLNFDVPEAMFAEIERQAIKNFRTVDLEIQKIIHDSMDGCTEPEMVPFTVETHSTLNTTIAEWMRKFPNVEASEYVGFKAYQQLEILAHLFSPGEVFSIQEIGKHLNNFIPLFPNSKNANQMRSIITAHNAQLRVGGMIELCGKTCNGSNRYAITEKGMSAVKRGIAHAEAEK